MEYLYSICLIYMERNTFSMYIENIFDMETGNQFGVNRYMNFLFIYILQYVLL